MFNDIDQVSDSISECDDCKNTTVEDYELIKVIDPIKKGVTNKGRKSGGIHVYCKSHIKPHLKVIKTSKHCLVWGK